MGPNILVVPDQLIAFCEIFRHSSPPTSAKVRNVIFFGNDWLFIFHSAHRVIRKEELDFVEGAERLDNRSRVFTFVFLFAAEAGERRERRECAIKAQRRVGFGENDDKHTRSGRGSGPLKSWSVASANANLLRAFFQLIDKKADPVQLSRSCSPNSPPVSAGNKQEQRVSNTLHSQEIPEIVADDATENLAEPNPGSIPHEGQLPSVAPVDPHHAPSNQYQPYVSINQ